MKESYDAVMLHGYMFKNQGLNAQTPNWLRNHMQDTAGAHLYHSGVAKKLFLPAGHYWGKDKPANSDLMKEELMRRGVPEDAIVTRPLALDTGTEIDLFTEEARIQGWEDIAGVSNATHTPRIRLNYHQKGIIGVDQIKAESVLRGITHRGKFPYQKFLSKFSKSRSEILFKFREKVVRGVTRLHQEENLRRISNFPFIQNLKAFFDS